MLKALSHGAILLAACKVRNSTLNKLWWKRVFANFTSIESRIALQVARKIARCDRTLIHVCLAYLFLHSGQVFSSFKELLRFPRRAPNFSKLWKLVHRSPHFDLISQWRNHCGGGGAEAGPPLAKCLAPSGKIQTELAEVVILYYLALRKFRLAQLQIPANPNCFAISMSFNGSGLQINGFPIHSGDCPNYRQRTAFRTCKM